MIYLFKWNYIEKVIIQIFEELLLQWIASHELSVQLMKINLIICALYINNLRSWLHDVSVLHLESLVKLSHNVAAPALPQVYKLHAFLLRHKQLQAVIGSIVLHSFQLNELLLQIITLYNLY